ncbi:MAG: phage/plasmid primase, P4 family [Methylovulum sp.]|nr:phage/plasmid primase, P4 family [Methylovulum sp.]
MQQAQEIINAIRPFCAAGLHLVPIPPDNGKPTKAPRAKGWNQPESFSNPGGYSDNADTFKHCQGFNVGLYHGASQTLALDLDDRTLACQVFEETAGIQLLDWLKDELRVEIKSPKANRGKLLFKLPPTTAVGLRQLKHNGQVIFELRSGNCQDVIHGQHPEGGAYQFIGNPAAIPPIPEVLLDMLQHWDDWKPCFDSALGIETEPPRSAPRKPQQSEGLPGRRDPIQEFNQSVSVQSVLIGNGYKPAVRDRFIRPGSTSKAPGAMILRNCADGIERVFSHGGDVLNDGFAHDAFDCLRLLEHGGDFAKALNWSPEITQHNRRLFRQGKAKCVAPQSAIEDEKPADQSPATTKTIQALIESIEKIGMSGLGQCCEDLGWKNTDCPAPKQKHYKVAIVHIIIDTAKKHNWHIIYDTGFFYIYTGTHWVALQNDEVKQLLKNAAIKIGYIEIECRDANFVDRLFQQFVQDGFFDKRTLKKQSIINLKNVSVVLNDIGVTTKPFDHHDRVTHQLDFDYNPKAINHPFLNYLADVLPDADTRRTLQQVTGYLFIKGLKMERVFFLYGEGANGKSVFFEVLSGVIGTDNISNYSLESLTDDKGYHRAKIKDKIVNYGTDIKLTKIDAGMFKTLASGEPIEARLPYCEPFMMSDYAKLIFNVNKLDNANIEHTHGFYRRLLIIPFNQTIAEEDQDKDLHKKILLDRAGVLNWIIEGAEQVIKNRNIFVSEECEHTKKRFIKESDSVAMFEAHIIETLPGSIYFETVGEAYNQYKTFCLDAGHRHPLGRNTFSKRMESLRFEKRKTETGWRLEKHYLDKKVQLEP